MIFEANCWSRLHHTFLQSMSLSNFDLKAPRWTKVAPKSSHDSAKMAPTWPKMASKVPKIAPTIIKNPGVHTDLPSWVHFGCECSADNRSANMRPHGHRLPRGVKIICWEHNPPKIAPRWPQHGPRWLQTCTRWSQQSSRTLGGDADLPSLVQLGCECSADHCSANMRPHDHHHLLLAV